jgi:ABC-type Mn2+/Zn2+ transport system ATPase subunit
MRVNHHKNIIEIRNISFGYRDKEKILDNISFDIHLGDYIGLIGPNGGGKTTLLKLFSDF